MPESVPLPLITRPDDSEAPKPRKTIPDAYVLGLLVQCYEPKEGEEIRLAAYESYKAQAINWLATMDLIEPFSVDPGSGEAVYEIWTCSRKGKFLVDSMMCLPLPVTYMAIPAQPARTSDPLA